VTTDEQIRELLRDIVDPCAAATGSNLDIVEMGLVKSIDVDDGHVRVDMRLTTPVCYQVPYFVEEIESRVQPLSGVESVTVETDNGFEWTPEMISADGKARRQAVLDGYASRVRRKEATTE
jgi:metal-sulfur cluster biosynthetic enzyme